ncbi:MAG TPA: LysR family transcriptional regulator [Blastocatellia bacterium]|nr:LysR family transcriptional regulator [Blastocatellia bacterium]
MDLHQLKVFHSAVTAGGLTHAGREMRLSQSTISHHIKQLEEELACQLFLRVGKRVLLTEAGQLLREHCEKIFQDVQNAEMSIRELAGMQRGRVRFGTGATTLIYQLPPVLETYQARFPNIELIVVSDITDNILRDVKAQRLDMGLVMLPVEERDLQVVPLCDEELRIAISSSHPLAGKRTLSLAALGQLRFILYEQKTVMRRLIDNYFKELGVTPRVAMVMENIEAIKSLVGAGLGVSVLPIHAVGKRATDRKVSMMRVGNHPLYRQLGLVTLKSSYVPNAIRELSALIAEELQGG